MRCVDDQVGRSPQYDAFADEAAAGFVIERLTEPRPVPEGARAEPDGHYERLGREPLGFMAFRLRPWSGA